MPEITYIPVNVIENFMIAVFTGLGVPEDDAHICADVLITSDLETRQFQVRPAESDDVILSFRPDWLSVAAITGLSGSGLVSC